MSNISEKGGLSQEGLKLIACTTMLIDHIGAALLPGLFFLRIIGRLAFPIYCFLLAEGVHHTRHPGRYCFRLFIGMVLAEYPFDALFFGKWTWAHQSVMVTLLLAFLMARCMKKVTPVWGKLLLIFPFALAAEWLHTDYGGLGVAMVALFVLTRELPGRTVYQALGLIVLCICDAGLTSIQVLCAFAMVPIAFYSGCKRSTNPAVQWAFYLFYPGHLAVLLVIARLLF